MHSFSSDSFASISKRFIKTIFFVVSGAVIGLSETASFAFDNEQAKQSFKKCRACHEIGPGAGNKVGPQLNGLEGRLLGSALYYRYSPTVSEAGKAGNVWKVETLDQFLKKPKSFLKGTRMSFVGIREDEERRNLVSWLFHFGADGKELSEKADANNTEITLLGASAAAITGDPEYGEYLSGECVTCHKMSGDDDGIPSIVGWPKENFVDALYQYKTGRFENPVMQTVTKRLGDEEMAALAAYFGSLKRE